MSPNRYAIDTVTFVRYQFVVQLGSSETSDGASIEEAPEAQMVSRSKTQQVECFFISPLAVTMDFF